MKKLLLALILLPPAGTASASLPWFDPLANATTNGGAAYTVGAPVCAPSRASFLLGVYQGHANVRDTQFDKALGTNHNVATVLKQAGYATAANGKWGLRGLTEGSGAILAVPR